MDCARTGAATGQHTMREQREAPRDTWPVGCPEARPEATEARLEGLQTRAQARLCIGFMHLDGDGVAQSDELAAEHFEAALQIAADGAEEARWAEGEADSDDCAPTRIKRMHDEECVRLARELFRDVQREAREALESIERFTFWANGRP